MIAASQMILSLKLIYSEEILKIPSVVQREYFFELVNSIPDNLFENASRHPHQAISDGKKLSSYIANLNIELRLYGADVDSINKKITDSNKQYAKMLHVPEWALNALKVKKCRNVNIVKRK